VLDVSPDHACRIHHRVEPRQTLDQCADSRGFAHVKALERNARIRGIDPRPLAF
jgi:hypothetical protein